MLPAPSHLNLNGEKTDLLQTSVGFLPRSWHAVGIVWKPPSSPRVRLCHCPILCRFRPPAQVFEQRIIMIASWRDLTLCERQGYDGCNCGSSWRMVSHIDTTSWVLIWNALRTRLIKYGWGWCTKLLQTPLHRRRWRRVARVAAVPVYRPQTLSRPSSLVPVLQSKNQRQDQWFFRKVLSTVTAIQEPIMQMYQCIMGK